MQYYSTNKQAPDVTLEEAVVKGLAADKGLFMPFTIKPLPQEFYDSIDTLGFQEIAYRVADAFFGEDVPADTLKQIVYDTLSFDVPLVKVTENIYSPTRSTLKSPSTQKAKLTISSKLWKRNLQISASYPRPNS